MPEIIVPAETSSFRCTKPVLLRRKAVPQQAEPCLFFEYVPTLPACLSMLYWSAAHALQCEIAHCAESNDDAVLELDLPFWTDPDDVRVRITPRDVAVSVRGSLDLRRVFWRNMCVTITTITVMCT